MKRQPVTSVTHTDRDAATRRTFLKGATAAAVGFTIVPRHVLGAGYLPPSDTLNIGAIGIGGAGRRRLMSLADQRIAALCDIDWTHVDAGFARLPAEIHHAASRLDEPLSDAARARLTRQIDAAQRFLAQAPRAPRYTDYRVLLDRERDLDAIVIATPDHTHAVIALAALQAGLHVLVESPLCWSVDEVRTLVRRTREVSAVTHVGLDVASPERARAVRDAFAADLLGDVHDVHVWTDRPRGCWPQGGPRVRSGAQAETGRVSAPSAHAWDLFLGPAPVVPFDPAYHPFNWRGWTDWGLGALGDAGPALVAQPHELLALGLPTTIETRATRFDRVTYPRAMTTRYVFPARGQRPAVTLTWSDGRLPPEPVAVHGGPVDRRGGVLYVGARGTLLDDARGVEWRPRHTARAEALALPAGADQDEDVDGGRQWIRACQIGPAMGIDGRQRRGDAPMSVARAADLMETLLLGIVALKADAPLTYDAANGRILEPAAANVWLRREPRAGWPG